MFRRLLPMASMVSIASSAPLVVLTVALAGASDALASEAPGADSVSLERAVREGAQRGPLAIEASRNHEAAAAFARRPGSSLPSVPQATVLAGARKPYNLPTGPEVTLTLQQEISMRGLGSARHRAAEWAARASASEVERARIEGGATAALAWVDLLEAQGLLHLRTSQLEAANRLARLAEVRVTSGVATAVERSLAKAEVGTAELGILDGEGRATEARIALAHATSAGNDATLSADGQLEATRDVVVAERTAIDALARHPAVRAAEARATQAAAEGSVARATAGPSFSVGASIWREGSGDQAAAAIVSLPLPFFDPARYDVGRQATIATAASSHAVRLRAELERELRLALHDREHTREVRTQLRDGVVAPLRSAVDTATRAYSAGTSDLGVVLLARRSALGAEEQLVAAMANVWRADIRLAALDGTLVGAGTR